MGYQRGPDPSVEKVYCSVIVPKKIKADAQLEKQK